MATASPPSDLPHLSERDPLLPKSSLPLAYTTETPPRSRSYSKKAFVASPLWLVPFFLTASISRGMTLAPRIEVLTNLACVALQPIHSSDSLHSRNTSTTFTNVALHYTTSATHSITASNFDPSTSSSILLHYDHPINASRAQPAFPKNCLTDPEVQQHAARLQLVLSMIGGILTALTTGWWGTLSDRIGRTKILTLSLIGCLFTDFVYLVIAHNVRRLVPVGGHYLIIIGPIVEGLLGGWSTLLSAVNAYVSDTTVHGSRSGSYGQFQGLLFVGVALGPALGSVLIKSNNSNTLVVFFASILISLLNCLFVILALPESLTDDARMELAAKRISVEEGTFEDADASWFSRQLMKATASLSPLALFLPKGKDWRLTYVGLAFFFFMLTTGLYPLKLMYAEQSFNWNAEALGHFLTFIGTARAVYLLFILPLIVKTFKPRPKHQASSSGDFTKTPESSPRSSQSTIPHTPSRANLTSDIKFDLHLARLSMAVDTFGYILVSLTTTPHAFLLSNGLSSFGSGTTAAIQSLALCFLPNPREDAGRMFGALSIIQTVAATVVSPVLFGLMYSMTVATFSKAIFVSGAGMLFIAIILLVLVRPRKRKILRRYRERGRSTRSKALWGSVAYSV